MSLPLRLPYSSPARRLRAVLLLPYFRAPVTPPPSPVWSPELDSEKEGSSPEGGSEEEAAWVCARGNWGRVLSGSVRVTPQGWASVVPQSTHHALRAWPKLPGPLPVAAASPSSPRVGSRCSARIPQPTRPALLCRRPSAPHGPGRAKDRQPGASGRASTGRREPEPRINSQIEWGWRTMERKTPPLPAPLTLASRGVTGRSACPRKSRKLGKMSSASPEKYQGNCKKVSLEHKKEWKSPDELWRVYVKES